MALSAPLGMRVKNDLVEAHKKHQKHMLNWVLSQQVRANSSHALHIAYPIFIPLWPLDLHQNILVDPFHKQVKMQTLFPSSPQIYAKPAYDIHTRLVVWSVSPW